jgi:hypothetical protein
MGSGGSKEVVDAEQTPCSKSVEQTHVSVSRLGSRMQAGQKERAPSCREEVPVPNLLDQVTSSTSSSAFSKSRRKVRLFNYLHCRQILP